VVIKDAVEAFWAIFKTHKSKKVKCSLNFTVVNNQSCFIPKTAISDSEIYPKVSNNCLK
jgi:hypothetical protein